MPAAEEKTRSLKHEQRAKARYSPAVLKISQENDIDLNSSYGTGNEGRITRKDLLALIESGNIPVASEVQAEPKVEQVSSATQPAAMTSAPKASTSKYSSSSWRY